MEKYTNLMCGIICYLFFLNLPFCSIVENEKSNVLILGTLKGICRETYFYLFVLGLMQTFNICYKSISEISLLISSFSFIYFLISTFHFIIYGIKDYKLLGTFKIKNIYKIGYILLFISSYFFYKACLIN